MRDRISRIPSLRRLPFRVRLTLGFAGIMILLFGGLALLLHTLFAASLDPGIDRIGFERHVCATAAVLDQGERPLGRVRLIRTDFPDAEVSGSGLN